MTSGAPAGGRQRERGVTARRLLALAAVVLLSSVLAPVAATASPLRTFVVATGSMEPTVPQGSLAVVRAGEPQLGDVIVFASPLGGHHLHRVVEVRQGEDGPLYVTRGDANDDPDSYVVPPEDVVGVLVRHVPALGELWLMPRGALLGAYLGAILVYLALVAMEATTRRHARLALLGAMMALCLMAPTVLGAVTARFPASTATAAVAATPLPHLPGSMGSAAVSADQNGATVSLPAPRLWKEIGMWNCRKDSTCPTTFTHTNYQEQDGSYWARIRVADYSPTPTFYFEAFMSAPAGATAYAILRDRSNGADVAASEVSTTSTSLVLVRSGAFTLAGEKDYSIRIKRAGGADGGELRDARLVLVQDFPTKTVEQVRLMQGDHVGSTSWAVPSRATRWRYDAAAWDGIASAHFEIVAEVDGNMLTDSRVRLVDRTAGTVVTTLTVTILDSSAKRFRSGDIKAQLVDGHEYEVETNRGDGVINDRLKVYVGRLLLFQSGFTKTVRHVDLAPADATSSSSFVTLGHRGRYQSATEWGPASGFFEATLRNTDSSGATSVRLVDLGGGTVVDGSLLASTGTARTRLRTGSVPLAGEAAEFRVEVSATGGTGEIRSAWLVVHQSRTKTYDSVLQTGTPAGGGCAWTFTLQYVSGSNLGRLAGATLTLRGPSTADQVVITSGTVSQSSGSAITAAAGSRLDHVVAADPTASGTSTIEAQLRGRCAGSGIHTVQPVTYVVA